MPHKTVTATMINETESERSKLGLPKKFIFIFPAFAFEKRLYFAAEKTSLRSWVTRAEGSVRIAFSCSPIILNNPLRDCLTT